MKREDLTEKLLDIKREKGWTWKYICEEIGGMSQVMITGGILVMKDDKADGGRRRNCSGFRNPKTRCSTKCRCVAPARRCRRPIH